MKTEEQGCRYLARIGAYYDGEVGPEERAALAEHIRGCAACAAELEGLRRLSAELTGAWEREEVPPAAVRRIHMRIDAQADRGLLRTAGALLAIAASLLLTTGLWLARSGAAASTPATWELTATNPQGDPSVNTSQEVATAQWIVQDLARRDGDE